MSFPQIVKCPFYHDTLSDNRVLCEGLMGLFYGVRIMRPIRCNLVRCAHKVFDVEPWCSDCQIFFLPPPPCPHKVAPPQRLRRPTWPNEREGCCGESFAFDLIPIVAYTLQLPRQIVLNETEINGAVRSTSYISVCLLRERRQPTNFIMSR